MYSVHVNYYTKLLMYIVLTYSWTDWPVIRYTLQRELLLFLLSSLGWKEH